MNVNFKQLLLLVVIGFLSAARTDLNAYHKNPELHFDWKLAASRWLVGAIIGAFGSMTIDATQLNLQ